jgi:hypothetical protein
VGNIAAKYRICAGLGTKSLYLCNLKIMNKNENSSIEKLVNTPQKNNLPDLVLSNSCRKILAEKLIVAKLTNKFLALY